MKRINQEHIIGVFCIALSIVILLITRTFPSKTTGGSDLTGPSFYPNLLSFIFILCGVFQIITGYKSQKHQNPIRIIDVWAAIRKPGSINILFIIGLILFFILLMESLGFILCAYVISFVLMWRFGVSMIKNVLSSALLVFLLVTIFGKLFTIYLPSGVLEYIGL